MQSFAQERGHPEIDPLHLLHALLQEGDGIVAPLLQKIGVNLTRLSQDQADYINVPADGPYKPEHYRY